MEAHLNPGLRGRKIFTTDDSVQIPHSVHYCFILLRLFHIQICEEGFVLNKTVSYT